MEDRERDRVSQRTTPTEAGQINRHVEEEKGRRNSASDVEFGQKIGRSENLSEGGDMRNRQEDTMKNTNLGNESSRRSSGESGYGSSSGRSSGSMGSESGVSGNRSGRSGSMDEESGVSNDRSGDSSSGRH
jgi:hypothetical protein